MTLLGTECFLCTVVRCRTLNSVSMCCKENSYTVLMKISTNTVVTLSNFLYNELLTINTVICMMLQEFFLDKNTKAFCALENQRIMQKKVKDMNVYK